jgi:hypothetical protein
MSRRVIVIVVLVVLSVGAVGGLVAKSYAQEDDGGWTAGVSKSYGAFRGSEGHYFVFEDKHGTIRVVEVTQRGVGNGQIETYSRVTTTIVRN